MSTQPTNETPMELYNNGSAFKGKIYCPAHKGASRFTEWLDRPGGYLKQRVCDECGHIINYPSGLSLYERIVYTAYCPNGHEVTVLTQDDNNPEYHASVGVVCPNDGEVAWFILPVN